MCPGPPPTTCPTSPPEDLYTAKTPPPSTNSPTTSSTAPSQASSPTTSSGHSSNRRWPESDHDIVVPQAEPSTATTDVQDTVGIYPAQTYARQTRKICPSKCPVTGYIRELPDGLTWIRLAELFGVARSTVYRAIQRAGRAHRQRRHKHDSYGQRRRRGWCPDRQDV